MIKKDAIEILKEIQDSLEETRFLERCAIDMAILALQVAPEINKGLEAVLNKMWTPCEEGIPEEMEDVLVWYEYFSFNRNKMVQMYGIGHVYKDFWCGDVQGERAKCIAWMPLPDPYKKEGGATND